jgi:tRNA uridine 5-carboxymethylaminomethyl modification enzyme
MFHVKQNYDVIVIGGGHAGCEAALAAARQGVDTLMITLDQKKIAEMSCNPSIGGVGKGQLVKEIDALGGEMGKNADFTGIQFRRLNTRKGSAVQSSRCQSDKRQYALRMQEVIRNQDRLTVFEGEVKALVAEGNSVRGVTVRAGEGSKEIEAKQVVITSGTFMKGLMHCGPGKSEGGRFGERSSVGLSDQLRALGFTVLRLKTGTPPRLLRGSIDFSQMEPQQGDDPPRRFSFSETKILLPQISCFLTYTNPATHRVIQENLSKSPLFSGQIKGVGPRYCPSIEDKVVKFPDKPRHQLFFEPEALDSDWIYPNGISTSLPAEVQEEFVKTIPGCAEVKFARPGYAVEYDCIDPAQLTASLESKKIVGLFFGGQVNGTSGYEEAAAQGLVAGINAGLKSKGAPPFTLSRAEAYIGVMIDDLIHLGVAEPYRMFTSRAEFRLSLREDNADARLRPYGVRLGLVSKEEDESFREKRARIKVTGALLEKSFVKPSPETQERLMALGTNALIAPLSLSQLLKRPELGLENVIALRTDLFWPQLDVQSQETLEVEIKYAGYIELQRQEIERLHRMQELGIPEALDYLSVEGLSHEIREKLERTRPKTLADASRISGVTPAALTALLFHLRQKGCTPGSAALTI